jgi:hypothetical protein
MQETQAMCLRRTMRTTWDPERMADTAHRLVGTGEAARALDIDRTTLARWAAAGSVTPASRTVGGHLRWDLDKLRAQLAELGVGPASDGG